LTSISRGWTETAPEAAAQFAAGLPAGPAQDSAALSVVSQWAASTPAEAAGWAWTFPDGTLRENALHNVFGTWLETDSRSLESWLGNLPAGTSRDAAVGIFADLLANSSPATSVQWLQTIQDPQARSRQLQNVAGRWLALDPPAARAWLAQSPLTQEQQAALGAITP
jgi:hypothetical protein